MRALPTNAVTFFTWRPPFLVAYLTLLLTLVQQLYVGRDEDVKRIWHHWGWWAEPTLDCWFLSKTASQSDRKILREWHLCLGDCRIADKLSVTQNKWLVSPSTSESVDSIAVNTPCYWGSWGGIFILEFVNRGSGVQLHSLPPTPPKWRIRLVGLGHFPLKEEITGSSPVCATNNSPPPSAPDGHREGGLLQPP